MIKVLALGAVLPTFALAGVQSKLYFCVYSPVTVTKTVEYTLTTSGQSCLYEPASNKTLKLKLEEGKHRGIYCAKQAVQVSSKSSSSGGDLCATSDSLLNVAVSSDDGASASGVTNWYAPAFQDNSVKLQHNPRSLSICATMGICGINNEVDLGYDGVKSVYLVYNPSAI